MMRSFVQLRALAKAYLSNRAVKAQITWLDGGKTKLAVQNKVVSFNALVKAYYAMLKKMETILQDLGFGKNKTNKVFRTIENTCRDEQPQNTSTGFSPIKPHSWKLMISVLLDSPDASKSEHLFLSIFFIFLFLFFVYLLR
jgi:hypothetical protein